MADEVIRDEKQPEYEKLIAAQNESKRRIKIKGINNNLSEEYKKKRNYAIITGVCFAGLMAATYFSGVNMEQALQTELRAINSFEAARDYLATFTPAMWLGVLGTSVALTKYLKHSKKYKEASQKFYDMTDNEPIEYGEIVEDQAKRL